MNPAGAALDVKRKKDIAYTAVLEGPENGREIFGWYLCIAKRDEPGYYQLKPGYGPYKDEEDARSHAQELNARMGLDPAEAIKIVLDSIACACRRRRRRRPR